MSSPCGHPGTICIFATGGGSGDFSGNVLCKVYWSKTPAYDCFSDMAAKLLLTLMLVFLCVCEGALLKKSTAMEFLQKVKEKRAAECFPGDCSSEVGELEEVEEEEQARVVYDGGAAQTDVNHIPGGEAVTEEGSGM